MRKVFIKITVLVFICSVIISCKRDTDYVSSSPSPFISNFDLKKAYKETDLTLTKELMKGANSIKGLVVSDFSEGNSPTGLLIVQNSRTVANGIDSVRGIAINLGTEAAKYLPGDSVHIKVEGSILKRVNGILQITGINTSAITKVGSGKTIKIPVVNLGLINASPSSFESTLLTIGNTVLEPEPLAGETFAGDRAISDGFGKATLHTEAAAGFANNQLPPSANFTGIILYKTENNVRKPQIWMRKADDSFEIPLVKPSPVIITGYLTNPSGLDADPDPNVLGLANEYIQFIATKDIDFSVTPFAVVTTNNAGSNIPTGFPTQGWATGGLRTYKFNLTSGTVRKGEFFYVGGDSKLIWGVYGSNGNKANDISTKNDDVRTTDISHAKWIVAINYAVIPGADFGDPTSNLLANSGNIAGIAVFEGTAVTVNSVPMDVIMYGGNGQFYTAGPPAVGYRITNTDHYSTINPSTRSQQLFYGAGSNVNKLGFQTEQTGAGGGFIRLGGIYDAATGRWKTGRLLKNIPMAITSQLSDIETGVGMTTLEN